MTTFFAFASIASTHGRELRAKYCQSQLKHPEAALGSSLRVINHIPTPRRSTCEQLSRTAKNPNEPSACHAFFPASSLADNSGRWPAGPHKIIARSWCVCDLIHIQIIFSGSRVQTEQRADERTNVSTQGRRPRAPVEPVGPAAKSSPVTSSEMNEQPLSNRPLHLCNIKQRRNCWLRVARAPYLYLLMTPESVLLRRKIYSRSNLDAN